MIGLVWVAVLLVGLDLHVIAFLGLKLLHGELDFRGTHDLVLGTRHILGGRVPQAIAIDVLALAPFGHEGLALRFHGLQRDSLWGSEG